MLGFMARTRRWHNIARAVAEFYDLLTQLEFIAVACVGHDGLTVAVLHDIGLQGRLTVARLLDIA